MSSYFNAGEHGRYQVLVHFIAVHCLLLHGSGRGICALRARIQRLRRETSSGGAQGSSQRLRGIVPSRCLGAGFISLRSVSQNILS